MGRVYEKDCPCRATASTGALRIGPAANRDDGGVEAVVTFYPQLSCDECGKPWKHLRQSQVPSKGGQ